MRVQAEEAFDAGQFEEALRASAECLALAAAHLGAKRAARDGALKAVGLALEGQGAGARAAWAAWARLALARLQLLRKRPVAATKLAEEASELFQGASDRRGEACAMAVVVDAHMVKAALVDETVRESHQLKLTPSEQQEELKAMRAKHYSNALHAALAALDLFGSAKDKRGKADLLCTLSEVRVALGGLDDAKEAAMNARDVYHDLGDPRGEQAALLTEMEAHIADADGTEALDVGREIVKVFRKAKDRRGEAEGMLVIMRVHSLMGQMDEMMQTASDIRSFARSDGDAKLEGQVADAVMRAQIDNGKLEEAAATAQEAVTIYRNGQDKQGEAMALHSLACLDLDKFFGETEANMAHFKKMGCMQQYYKDIKTADYEGALRMLDSAVALFREAGDDAGRQMAEETVQASQRRAAMLNEPDETRQIFRDGRVVDVVRTWNPRAGAWAAAIAAG